MHVSKPSDKNHKKVCENFSNLLILTRITTPGEVQLMIGHMVVGNKSLWGSVLSFALVGGLISPSAVSLKVIYRE